MWLPFGGATLTQLLEPKLECLGDKLREVQATDQEFEKYLGEAIDNIPAPYKDHLENVAFILEDDPSPEQRVRLSLHPNQTLLGLYEGVPLPARSGTVKLLPDKITIFKNPLLAASQNTAQLRENIGRTVWHEVAHYYGLDHTRIHELERKPDNS
jgi:predicted Zn-dependent protease with MMP-like domain